MYGGRAAFKMVVSYVPDTDRKINDPESDAYLAKRGNDVFSKFHINCTYICITNESGTFLALVLIFH